MKHERSIIMERYEKVEMEVIYFENEDIITSSNPTETEED